MIVDLHNHTSMYSQCSLISPERLIESYIAKGVDGICITEHELCWPRKEQEELKKKYAGKIEIFFGAEISTEIGHVLYFSTDLKYNDFNDIINFSDLKSVIDDNKTALVWAHPFRWPSGFFGGKTEINLQDELTTDFFNQFDAVEYYNGNLSDDILLMTKNKLAPFDIKLTGGSDTHSIEMAAKYGTRFKNSFDTLEGLIDNLKNGEYEPAVL